MQVIIYFIIFYAIKQHILGFLKLYVRSYAESEYEMHINYLVKGFPLKSATWRVLQYEMLSGSSIMSVRKKRKQM